MYLFPRARERDDGVELIDPDAVDFLSHDFLSHKPGASILGVLEEVRTCGCDIQHTHEEEPVNLSVERLIGNVDFVDEIGDIVDASDWGSGIAGEEVGNTVGVAEDTNGGEGSLSPCIADNNVGENVSGDSSLASAMNNSILTL